MARPSSVETKVNMNAQLQTFPYQTIQNHF